MVRCYVLTARKYPRAAKNGGGEEKKGGVVELTRTSTNQKKGTAWTFGGKTTGRTGVGGASHTTDKKKKVKIAPGTSDRRRFAEEGRVCTLGGGKMEEQKEQ